MGVFFHASSLRRLVFTMIKTAQSFSVHFHSLNLNFQYFCYTWQRQWISVPRIGKIFTQNAQNSPLFN